MVSQKHLAVREPGSREPVERPPEAGGRGRVPCWEWRGEEGAYVSGCERKGMVTK